MRVGQHNRSVTLWRTPQASGDADGFFEALSPSSWWAQIQPLTSSDAGRSIFHQVTMRYHSQVTMDTRVLYGARELFVRGVQNMDERNVELRLLCEEIVP